MAETVPWYRKIRNISLSDTTSVRVDHVVSWIGSANRDPQQFEKPETFDPERKPNRHIAFGSGIHFCLGASLARLEAKTVLPVFFDRISDVRITTDESQPIMSPQMYGL
jgi:cytochrome P450